MAMTLISTVNIGSGGSSSIQFTNIPQSGKDLIIKLSILHNTSGGGLYARFNGNSSSVYSGRELAAQYGYSVSVSSYSGDTLNTGYYEQEPSVTQIYISDYASSNNKPISIESTSTGTYASEILKANLFASSSPVTSIEFGIYVGFLQYSSASLYVVS